MATNVKQKIVGTKLILEIDLSENHGPSKSGKTIMVGSSGGFEKVEGSNVSYSLNVCSPIKS